jgi:hypothetical protein
MDGLSPPGAAEIYATELSLCHVASPWIPHGSPGSKGAPVGPKGSLGDPHGGPMGSHWTAWVSMGSHGDHKGTHARGPHGDP